MSIFDIDDNLERVEENVKFEAAQEKILLQCITLGAVKCVVFTPNINLLLKKLNDIYGIPMKEPSFATYIQTILNRACHSLRGHKQRRVVSLDCRKLKKGDAFGWMKALSQDEDNLIVVLENVTQIPVGDQNIYDNRQYVENLLIRSWKNDVVFFDGAQINRRNLTIILTCPPEDETKLKAECSACSYAWVGDIMKIVNDIIYI
jgi:hypothetical protein